MANPAVPFEASKSLRNFGLDLLRALAIVLVLLSHGRACIAESFPVLKDFFVFGYLGVEMFFVLSGFLIGGILVNIIRPGCRFSDLKNFWVRRWFRTLPNYYLFLIVEFVLAATVVHGANLWKFSLYPVFLQTFYYPVRPVYFSVSWSLAVEEWFYLLVPVLLFVAVSFLKVRSKAFGLTIASVILLSLALRIFYVLALNADWGPDIRNTTILRLDSIVFGLLGAYVFFSGRDFWERFKYPAFCVGLVSFVANAIYVQLVDRDVSFYCRTLQFTVIPLSVLLCLPLIRSMSMSDGFVKKAIEHVSLWSYSLYLCHMIVLRFVEQGMAVLEKKCHLGHLQPGTGFIAFGAFIFGSLILSSVVYKYYEKPMTSFREVFSKKERHSY